MIHPTTINAVYPLADLLKERGIAIRPLATTPVAQLVQACHYDLPTQGLSEEVFDPETQLIKGSTTPGPDGAVKHDVTMDEMVEIISETVKGNLHVARNVVNPIIKEVVADVQEHMQYAENRLQADISVVPDYYEAVWNSPTLDGLVDRYSETAYREIKLVHDLPLEQEEFAIDERLHTGSVTFDEDIDEIVAAMGEDKVLRLYGLVFGGAGARQGVLGNVLQGVTRNEALIIHLLARRLSNNPPAGVNLPLSQYEEYIAHIVAQTGRHLHLLRQKRLRAQNQNLLVSEWPPGRDSVGKRTIEIRVNGDLYTKFLDEGGSPEAVMGSFITDQVRQASALLEGKERFERAWEKQHRILITSQRLNRFNHGVEGLRQAMARQINDLDEDTVPVPKEVLHKKLEENLSLLYGHWYEKPYEYVRKVVCQTIFPHTMAMQILCAIDHVCDDHPGIEVREAALLATIEIVAAWVAKLCVVEQAAA